MHARMFTLVTLLILGSIPIWTGPANATTVPEMNLRELAAAAPDIVYGTVLSTSSRWNEDRSIIVTDVRILVNDALKGKAGGEITVTQPGGEVGKIRVDVPGAAAFKRGQEAVLFLAPDSRGRYHVAGLSQGRFNVVEDRLTNVKKVRGVPREDGVQPSSPGQGPVVPPARPVGLDEFLNDLRALVRDVNGGNR